MKSHFFYHFYFLFTDSNESIDFVHGKFKKKIIEILIELELFIDKKMIFDDFFFRRSAVHRPLYVCKFCNPHNFFFFST
jgi:hypothetical protein